MTTLAVLVALVASLLSGIAGVVLSFGFYSWLERRRLKVETARKLFGNRHRVHEHQFQEAINEVMIVFSDSQLVIDAMENLWKVVETPQSSRAANAADDALIQLMKAICADLKIKYKHLPDTYFLRFFSIPR
ncbi:DUF6680 family protein [Salinisphaera sp. RV14]|uniref:DUF6680 family protein n=1 Tax=Salinisphaera sp. RV14 TaxID=3454140 RepID=UPI003F83A58A